VPEQVARDVADMTARSAELQAEEVFELYKRVVADMGDEALTLSTRTTPKDVERDYQQVRSKYLDLERQSQKLADENLRLAEEEAAIQREAARLSDLKAAQERRKRELSDEQKRLESSGFPNGLDSSPGGGGGYTLPSLPTLEQPLKSTPCSFYISNTLGH
jgi:chromosome segregation ATPase